MDRQKPRKTSGDGGQVKRLERFVSRSGSSGDGATRSAECGEFPTSTANWREYSLTQQLMERVTAPDNMNMAFRRVVSNKGAAGVDRMTVDQLRHWIDENRKPLLESLRTGTYKPQPVLGVEIPKPAGGKRLLGIPTVVDRLVQQSMSQVLESILDPKFSKSSYGFRPGRSAHDALRQAEQYVTGGRVYVVDIDLEKFFDRVNHDILMSRLARFVQDKRFLRITRRFLNAGMMRNGVVIQRDEGTPQGGPLSPLLSNLLLDDLDKELERRGHAFCRYADDCNIYVRSREAGERVLNSVTKFLEKKLKLRVNREKSAVDVVWRRKFLGYRLLGKREKLIIAPESLHRFKDKIRSLTRRNQAMSFEGIIQKLNSYLSGWFAYFQYGMRAGLLQELDEWIRRKLRCYRLKQCKRRIGLVRFLQSLGVSAFKAWILAFSGKGWWRLSLAWQSTQAMSLGWFRKMGLVSLSSKAGALYI